MSPPGGKVGEPVAERRVTGLGFADLRGWAEDDHAAALQAFLVTCDRLDGVDLAHMARLVGTGDAREFFEARFRPVLIEDGTSMLFTGYYEPEIEGRLEPSERFPVPLYRLPPEVPKEQPWLTRAEIEGGALTGRGLEIAWVADAVEAFFLQVQGSGRIRLPNGDVLRLGYAGKNGQPYASVGRMLIERGALGAGEATADHVRDWLRRHPEEGRTVMQANAAFVFFRELALPPEVGPLGAMDRPVTPLRSLAVDPSHVPLGAPVWIETDGTERLRRLMIAQDTGGAIKGAQRADIYVGTGAQAGHRAGRIRDGGRMVVLLPTARAQDLLAGLP